MTGIVECPVCNGSKTYTLEQCLAALTTDTTCKCCKGQGSVTKDYADTLAAVKDRLQAKLKAEQKA